MFQDFTLRWIEIYKYNRYQLEHHDSLLLLWAPNSRWGQKRVGTLKSKLQAIHEARGAAGCVWVGRERLWTQKGTEVGYLGKFLPEMKIL